MNDMGAGRKKKQNKKQIAEYSAIYLLIVHWNNL